MLNLRRLTIHHDELPPGALAPSPVFSYILLLAAQSPAGTGRATGPLRFPVAATPRGGVSPQSAPKRLLHPSPEESPSGVAARVSGSPDTGPRGHGHCSRGRPPRRLGPAAPPGPPHRPPRGLAFWCRGNSTRRGRVSALSPVSDRRLRRRQLWAVSPLFPVMLGPVCAVASAPSPGFPCGARTHTCTRVHTRTCAHPCTHMYMRMNMHTHIHTHAHVYTCAHAHMHTPTCAHVCAHTHVCMHPHTCTYTHVCTCSHTCAHAHTYTHAHTCTR